MVLLMGGREVVIKGRGAVQGVLSKGLVLLRRWVLSRRGAVWGGAVQGGGEVLSITGTHHNTPSSPSMNGMTDRQV